LNKFFSPKGVRFRQVLLYNISLGSVSNFFLSLTFSRTYGGLLWIILCISNDFLTYIWGIAMNILCISIDFHLLFLSTTNIVIWQICQNLFTYNIFKVIWNIFVTDNGTLICVHQQQVLFTTQKKHTFISLRVSYYSKDKRPWPFSNLTWYPKQRFIHSLIHVTAQNHTSISLRVSDCYEDERTTLVCSRYSKHRFIHCLSFAIVGHWYVSLFTLQHKKHKINSLRVSNYYQDERPWLSTLTGQKYSPLRYFPIYFI
jgi:hypothetical protein